MRDPERPAFLQVLRTHEIGRRHIPDLLDAITAQPFDGLRSIAAGLYGRAGKEPAPARGATAGWTERAPQEVTPEIETAGQMLDARQAALGERLAANPPAWAMTAWGDPRAKTGGKRPSGNGWRALSSPTARQPGSPTRNRRPGRYPPGRPISGKRSSPPSGR